MDRRREAQGGCSVIHNTPTITPDRVYRHFASFADYAGFCIQTGMCDTSNDENPSRFGDHWRRYSRFMEAMQSGQAEPQVMEIAQRLRIEAADVMKNAEGPSKRRRRVWADQGDEINIDRMNARNEKPWTTTQIGRPSPVVRILAMFDCNGKCNTAQFGAAAAAVALASDALANAGYSFEVWAIQHGDGSRWSRQHTVTACVKGAGEPLDLQRVASVFTIPAIRFLGFGLIRKDMHPVCMGVCRTPDRATLALCSATGSVRPEDFGPKPTDAEIVRLALSLMPTEANTQPAA